MFHDFDFKIKVINFYDFPSKQNIKTNKKNGEVAKHPSYLTKSPLLNNKFVVRNKLFFEKYSIPFL